MKLNKEEIRQIALNRFHDKYHESVYDCWTDALECWLDEKEAFIITKKEFEETMDAAVNIRLLTTKNDGNAIAALKKSETEREAGPESDDSEEPKD